jgi:hypothetical protein
MMVNVNQPAMAQAQPVMAQAQPVPVMAQPIMGQPVTPQPQEMLVMGTVMPSEGKQAAPQPQGMARGPMDGRVEEIQMGWYTQSGAPCCYFMQLTFNSDRTLISGGPGCFCCLCIGCFPGCCGQFKVEAPGTASFKGVHGEVMTWQSSTSYMMTGGMSNGEVYRRCC